ncbi:MAG: hypothetical protein JW940_20230 [Polyangiaceae bacterium]|nr:hypothetical protein [Polyangiaceae bacterium]
MPSTEPAPHRLNDSPRSLAAYEQLLPEILAVPEADGSPILIDIPTAVTTVLGVLPKIHALSSEMTETLPKFDFERFDRLEQYTLALSHAHALRRAAHGPKPELGTLGAELGRIRDVLLADARSLAAHGLIHGERLSSCRSTPGYRALAYDVLTLVQVLRDAWDTIKDQTPVKLGALNEAAMLAEGLLSAVGLRDEAKPTTEEALVIRRKAFTLFMRVYARVRAAVQYLRAELGDADEIAPSLYAGRVKRHKRGEQADAAEPRASSGAGENGASGSGGGLAPEDGGATPAPRGGSVPGVNRPAPEQSRERQTGEPAAGEGEQAGQTVLGRPTPAYSVAPSSPSCPVTAAPRVLCRSASSSSPIRRP